MTGASVFRHTPFLKMIDQKEQSNFFAQFFSQTELVSWEGRVTVRDSGQRVKTYPRLPRHKLPPPAWQLNQMLGDALRGRQSAQELSPEKLTLFDVSAILAGVGLRHKSNESGISTRTYPSAGAKYPGETYIIILDCDALLPGLYHYAVDDHELDELWIQDLREPLLTATNDRRILSASVVVVFSLIYGRTSEKYGDRGLRYGLIELGHMAQNISLIAYAIDKGCYDMGGFIDPIINTWLDIDNESESAALLVVLGGKQRPK